MPLHQRSDSEHCNPKGNKMYLTTGDMLAVIIALVVSVTLVITTALANAKLQRKIDQLRTQRWEITKEYESIISDLEQK